jgi:hypothetical protein
MLNIRESCLNNVIHFFVYGGPSFKIYNFCFKIVKICRQGSFRSCKVRLFFRNFAADYNLKH